MRCLPLVRCYCGGVLGCVSGAGGGEMMLSSMAVSGPVDGLPMPSSLLNTLRFFLSSVRMMLEVVVWFISERSVSMAMTSPVMWVSSSSLKNRVMRRWARAVLPALILSMYSQRLA